MSGPGGPRVSHTAKDVSFVGRAPPSYPAAHAAHAAQREAHACRFNRTTAHMPHQDLLFLHVFDVLSPLWYPSVPMSEHKEDLDVDELVEAYVRAQPQIEWWGRAVLSAVDLAPSLKHCVHSLRFRLKDPKHLRDKIIRKRKEDPTRRITLQTLFEQIEDLAGIRILHLYKSDLVPIHKYLMEAREWSICGKPVAYNWDDQFSHIFTELGDIDVKKKASLYTSVHYVVSNRSPQSPDGFRCEIQVRTLIEESWGEIDHQFYPGVSLSTALRNQLEKLNRFCSLANGLAEDIRKATKEHEGLESQLAAKDAEIRALREQLVATTHKTQVNDTNLEPTIGSKIADSSMPSSTIGVIGGVGQETKNIVSNDEEKSVETKEEDFLVQSLVAIMAGEPDNVGRELFAKAQSSEPDPGQKKRNEVIYLSLRVERARDSDALRSLEKLAEDPGARPNALQAIGKIYEKSGDINAAETYYMRALDSDPDIRNRTTCTVALGRILAKLERTKEALEAHEALLKHTDESTKSDILVDIYTSIASVYKKQGDKIRSAIMLQKASILSPINNDLRWSAAYAFSQLEETKSLLPVSIFNYLKFENMTKDSHMGTTNNLGVAYQNSDLTAFAIDNYKKSAALKGTLAMANLALLYIHGGFLDDARKILDEARRSEDVHANVGHAMTQLDQRHRDELERAEKCHESGQRIADFLAQVAAALHCGPAADWEGTWKTHDRRVLRTVLHDGQLDMRWIDDNGNEYEIIFSFGRSAATGTIQRKFSFNKYFTRGDDVAFVLITGNSKLTLLHFISGTPSFEIWQRSAPEETTG